MKSSEVRRINKELAEEIEKVAKKNQMKFLEASREIARMLKQKQNKKFIREIEF